MKKYLLVLMLGTISSSYAMEVETSDEGTPLWHRISFPRASL